MPRPFLALAYQFQWSVLWTAPYLGWLLQGIATTLTLAGLSWVLAATLGAVFGAVRTAPSRFLRGLGVTYVEFFRNVPLLVWMFLWYFGASQLLPLAAQDWLNRHNGEFVAAVSALGVYHGARIAEVVRAGIQSVSRGQVEAAGAIGLHRGFALRLIVLPQAIRLIIPPLTSQYLNIIKNSSLAVFVGYPDLVQIFAGTVLNQTHAAVQVMAITMAVYLVISLVVAGALNLYNSRRALKER
jgi:His/Glu/Gln/Arg/opine family amino acid ABC transporter permease subunit